MLCFGLSVVFGSIFCSVAVLSCLFVFSKSSVQVSAIFTNMCCLTVGAFDLVDCALSVAWLFYIFNFCK